MKRYEWRSEELPTKLKHLQIKRVALVDEGANQDAFVKFAKRKEAPGDTVAITSEEAENAFKRFASLVSKAFGFKNPIAKAAYTFSEGEEKRDYDRIMDSEVYPMHWAFNDSVRSILLDTDKDDAAKAALLKQSLSEFTTAFGACLDSWSKAEPAQIDIKKNDDALLRMRDSLNDLIVKQGGCGSKKPMKKAEDSEDSEDEPNEEDQDDAEDDGKKKPPVVKKGATDMKFNTEKMTASEKETYESLVKRYATEETTVAPTTDTPKPAEPADASGTDDVYKGIHPAVKAELENLRKFREESEARQFNEVAKKYTLLGKKPEELAPLLKSLKDVGGTTYDDMIAMLDANLSAFEKSGVFSEIGKRGSNSTDDAWQQIESAAQEIIKSKPDMHYADAIDAACMAHPELVQEYEKSRR